MIFPVRYSFSEMNQRSVRLCLCVALPREPSPFSENDCENIPQLLFVLKREKTNPTVGWAPALSALLKCCVCVFVVSLTFISLWPLRSSGHMPHTAQLVQIQSSTVRPYLKKRFWPHGTAQGQCSSSKQTKPVFNKFLNTVKDLEICLPQFLCTTA